MEYEEWARSHQIELKQWDKYSPDEKKRLLFHWWNMYGRDVTLFEEHYILSHYIHDHYDNIFLMILSYLNLVYSGIENASITLLREKMNFNQEIEMSGYSSPVLLAFTESFDYSSETFNNVKLLADNFLESLVNSYNINLFAGFSIGSRGLIKREVE